MEKSYQSMDHFWMPFTANRAFKASPRIIERAEGMWLYNDQGQQILDGIAGLWCVNAGHGRRSIADAISAQIQKLDYSSPFNMGHDIGFEFAERLTRYTPEGMDRVFFANSGSESVETALKIALAYHRARGKSGKIRFIGREKGYHGVNFGGITVGGITPNRSGFGPLMPVDHFGHTHDLAANAFSRGLPEHGADKADELQRLIDFHGADTVAAVIVEPVSGAGGVLMPPIGYLQRLRDICSRHDILLIFDEVITGWGRLGAPFAARKFEVTPDLITSAKGISNGLVPLGAVFMRNEICDTVQAAAPDGSVEFFHGYTYSGSPIGCAAGLATLNIYDQEGLLTRASGEIGAYFEESLHSLANAPGVVDVRNCGLIGAVQFAPNADGSPRAPELSNSCYAKGAAIRPIGDNLAFSPPLIIEKAQVDQLVETVFDAAKAAYA